MAHVTLACRDLLFGSRVESALTTAGHEVLRVDGKDEAIAALRDSDALVIDLTDPDLDGVEIGRAAADFPTLGFYAHVDQDTRRRADAAGFDRVVPRSRMAREAPALVMSLVGE